MSRALQAVGIVATALTAAAIGFVAGVVLMARTIPNAPMTDPPRWERSL